jgi:thymidylate kinase
MRQPGAAIGDHEAGPTARDLRLEHLLTVRVVGAAPGAACAEEWSRLRRARRLARAGGVVVLDRSQLHDYDHHDVEGPGRSPAERLHGWWLRRVLPRPELSVFLDAPLATLRARKPEGSLDDLRRRCEEYRDLEGLTPGWARVDAGAPPEAVAAAVADAIRGFLRERG